MSAVAAPTRTTRVTFDRRTLGECLAQLGQFDTTMATRLFNKLTHCWDGYWGTPKERSYCSASLSIDEYSAFKQMNLPSTVIRCNYIAVYLDPVTGTEVKVYSNEKPPKKKSFRTGSGRRRLIRTNLYKTTFTIEGATLMARKATPTVEIDLEDLEDLEEIEDTEDEDEDTDDDEVEEITAKPVRTAAERARARREARKAAAAPAAKAAPAKSAKAAKAAPAKAKSESAKPKPPGRGPLPAGKVGPDAIAELAGVDARSVRMFLRKNEVEKDAETGRYSFSQKEAAALAKRLSASSK